MLVVVVMLMMVVLVVLVVAIVVMVVMVVIVVVAAAPVMISIVVVALIGSIMRLHVRKMVIVKTRLNHIELHVSPADSSLVVGWLDRKGRHLLQMRR